LPHSITLETFAEFGKTLAFNLPLLEEAVEQLQKGTYDIWKVNELITLEDSPVK